MNILTIANSIYYRLIFGIVFISLGLIDLKLYLHRNEDDKWGRAYHRIQKLGYSDVPSSLITRDTCWLILTVFIFLMALIVMFFGFR